MLPQLKASIPQGIDMRVAMDQTVTIRASVSDVERTLVIAILLVLLVVFAFLREPRATLIPGVAVPVSLVGSFGIMYLLGFSLDNLSLMALTISTGFVVDDAIVVIENITRYLEQGMKPFEAALKGAQEIGFTVLTISISLVAVFIPLLLMGGIVGRLFREFALTLSIAIVISMVVSLTTTPMMCAHLLKKEQRHGRFYRITERGFNAIVSAYGRALNVVLRYSFVTLLILLGTIALNVYLFIRVPKGFFPIQDTGRLNGSIQADQDTSFQQMNQTLRQFVGVVDKDPAVDTVIGFTGGGRRRHQFRAHVHLSQTAQSTGRRAPGHRTLAPAVGSRAGRDSVPERYPGSSRGRKAEQCRIPVHLERRQCPGSDRVCPAHAEGAADHFDHRRCEQRSAGPRAASYVDYDRKTAARLGLSSALIDQTLYDAFGQRPVSTMYTSLNQYYVIMEAAPQYWQNPEILKQIYVQAPSGGEVPLSAFAHFAPEVAALSVAHQGLFPAVTISFDLKPGVALGDAVNAINAAARKVQLPSTIHTFFAGTAQVYQESFGNEPVLIAAALLTVYLVLGILYESYIHPVTILSTLPSAGVGALLALLLTHTDLTIIAMIGIVL